MTRSGSRCLRLRCRRMDRGRAPGYARPADEQPPAGGMSDPRRCRHNRSLVPRARNPSAGRRRRSRPAATGFRRARMRSSTEALALVEVCTGLRHAVEGVIRPHAHVGQEIIEVFCGGHHVVIPKRDPLSCVLAWNLGWDRGAGDLDSGHLALIVVDRGARGAGRASVSRVLPHSRDYQAGTRAFSKKSVTIRIASAGHSTRSACPMSGNSTSVTFGLISAILRAPRPDGARSGGQSMS